MRLNDARKLAIRKQVRIRFALPGGAECVINEHGISQVPGLNARPEFNLEQEFAQASRFTLEPVTEPAGRKTVPTVLSREQLETLAAEKTAAADHSED